MSKELSSKELYEQILSADDLKKERVHVPEWGVDVWVRQLTAKQQDTCEKQHFAEGKSLDGFRARMLVYSLIDHEGNSVFTEKDIDKISNKSGGVLSRLMNHCTKLNEYTEKDLEELAKNS